MPKLYRRTKNLIIRPLETKDYKVWREGKLACKRQMNRWDNNLCEEHQITRKRYQELLRRGRDMRRKDYFYDLKIFDRKTGATVGGVSLMEVTRGISQTCYLGYYLYNNYWGRGWAKEAVKAAFDIGFKDLKLHRIEAGIEPSNKRSLRLARSLKMRREGLKKRAIHLRGDWIDLVMFTLTTEDLNLKFRGNRTKSLTPLVVSRKSFPLRVGGALDMSCRSEELFNEIRARPGAGVFFFLFCR